MLPGYSKNVKTKSKGNSRKMSYMEQPPHDPNARLNRISAVAFELDEQIAQTYGDSAEVAAVLIIVDLVAPNGDGGIINPVVYQSNELRRWVQEALIREALAEATHRNAERVEEADETLGVSANDDEDDDEDDDDDD
jgi:hypothetical protein